MTSFRGCKEFESLNNVLKFLHLISSLELPLTPTKCCCKASQMILFIEVDFLSRKKTLKRAALIVRSTSPSRFLQVVSDPSSFSHIDHLLRHLPPPELIFDTVHGI